MDAATIDQIASLMPTSYAYGLSTADAALTDPGSLQHALAAQSFVAQYSVPAFGWHATDTFARQQLPFPVVMTGRDHWVYRAYLHKLDPNQFFDKTVATAHALQFHETTGGVTLAAKVQSLLLAFDGSQGKTEEAKVLAVYDYIADVAKYLGMPYELVEAYEILFFNVLDRKKDALFLAHEVYPGTRFVEFQESYFNASAMGDLVRRAGYNYRNVQMTAYLLGIGDRSFVSNLSSSVNREEELTRHFMGNGLIMARANLLNHRSVGLSRTTTLLAAARQGGQVATEHPLVALSDSFSSQVRRVKEATQEGFAYQLRKDAGEIVEVTVVD